LLPKDRRYVGLMIGNVIGIAVRELQAGALALASEAERTSRLLAAHDTTLRDIHGGVGELPELRRSLCAAIRAGRFDAGEARAALMSHLGKSTADWVAISNPKALRPA